MASFNEIRAATDAFYVRDLDGGIDRMRRLTFDRKIEPVSAGERESASEISVTPTEPGALIRAVSWNISRKWMKFEPKTKAVTDDGSHPTVNLENSGTALDTNSPNTNTIDDFIASAQYLIEDKYTSERNLSGEGTSAGGILIGAPSRSVPTFSPER